MPRRYCTRCWSENPWAATTCEACGAPLTDVHGAVSYREKLLDALRHPEPETRARAAELLGKTSDPGDEQTIEALRALLEERSPAAAQRDMGTIAAAATALGTLRACSAADPLSALALNDAMPLYLGLVAVDVLENLARAQCAGALAALDGIAAKAGRQAIRHEAATCLARLTGLSGISNEEHDAQSARG